MNVYTESDYREILRQRVRELSKEKTNFKLKSVAEKIPIQYTYLSKALNDPKTHLNEDHLYSMCQILELLPEETDYVFLLRAYSTSGDKLRRNYLQGRIDRKRREQVLEATPRDFDTRALSQEMAYLFEPLCVLVHVCLSIKAFAENPRLLGKELGISQERLQTVIRKLHTAGFVVMDDRGRVVKVNHEQIHYGTDHPLMRVHQSLLRQMGASQLLRCDETAKHSFMSTFTCQEEDIPKIKERFQTFLKDVERLVMKSPSERCYQLNFDLFRWV